jgi:hypothetical protein
MDRRSFLNSVLAFAATATLDPEKLLWTPGRKAFSIPKPPSGTSQWSEFINSSPLDVVDFRSHYRPIGQPNRIVLSADIWLTLKNHPEFIDKIRYVPS